MKPLLLLVVLALAHAVYLPMKPNRPRCLSEYLLGGASSSIKIKINFPKLDGLEPGEHFTVTLRNTETQKIDTDIVQPGDKYAKETDLDKSNSPAIQTSSTRCAPSSSPNGTSRFRSNITLKAYTPTTTAKWWSPSPCSPSLTCRAPLSPQPTSPALSMSTRRSTNSGSKTTLTLSCRLRS